MESIEELLERNPFEQKIVKNIELARENLLEYQKLFMRLIGELMKLSEYYFAHFQNVTDPKVLQYSEITFHLLNKIVEMREYLDSFVSSIQNDIISYSRTLANEIEMTNKCRGLISSNTIERTSKRAVEYLAIKDDYSGELQEIIKGYDKLIESVSEIAKKFDKDLYEAIVMKWMVSEDNVTEDYLVEESVENIERKGPTSPMYM